MILKRIISRGANLALATVLAFITAGPLLGFQVRQEPSSFDSLVIWDPSNVNVVILPFESLPSDNLIKAGWNSFKAAHGAGWKIYLDARSGAPMLVEGQGIPMIPGNGNTLTGTSAITVDYLEKLIREFTAKYEAIFLAKNSELVLNRDASMQVTPELWQIVFNRIVDGIPVEGERFIFSIGNGNLISFGASRWSKITTSSIPSLTSEGALQNLYGYMGLRGTEGIVFINDPELLYLPLSSTGMPHSYYFGALGEGYTSSLVWKYVMKVAEEPGTWVGMVDAHSGAILALYDDSRYAQVKGGVYPESDDQICPSGCEQPNFPMPFADMTISGNTQYSGSGGYFDCDPAGATATTTLNGLYVYTNDSCGSISQSVTCDDDLDLGVSGGIDCAVPAGASPGNTHSSRTSFYALNRGMETARFWLPSNTWLQQKLTNNVNISPWCNAQWTGAVNFYRSSSGCNNTGEIAGVILHEWGHGMDANDGGGYDNPSEAYADVSDFMYDHTSCIGRGFYTSQNCTGYGNTCLDCTGIRDQDYIMHIDPQPATPTNLGTYCGGGRGPCGWEDHCEAAIGSQAMWDLAARDLPAEGYDQATAWHITDRVWFKSRAGSSGNAYNCSPPDGCSSTAWFTKLRNVDDDNGNLNDGTPHAAAIFNAFNRHLIACGSASDNSNKSNSACPSIGATTLSGAAGSNSASLSWTPVTNASSYYVLRNDYSCDWSYTVIANVPAPTTNYTDTGLGNDFYYYYRIVPVGANSACYGPVSNCEDVGPQPFAGSIKFDRATYNCDWTITITVRDANVGASTINTTIWSTVETIPETIVLTETMPGSSKFVGSILTTPGPAVHGDGYLSIADWATITGEYIDADDGAGGHGLVRQTTATADCVGPAINDVQTTDVYDNRATVTWTTNEASDSTLIWGPDRPPTNTKTSPTLVTSHSLQLTGLGSCTIYYYEVNSSDATLNTARDDNGGNYYHFETLRYDPAQGYVSCHAGRVYLDRTVYSCSQLMTLKVIDLDLDTNEYLAETITVTVTSTSEPAVEEIVLTETGLSTGEFTGTIMTDGGAPVHDGNIQVKNGDHITVTYHDADDGTGSPALHYQAATVDCAGPVFSNIKVTDIPPFTFRISWNTSEPATSRLDYGTTTALGNTLQDATLKTSHSFTIAHFDQCQNGYFKISGNDSYGNLLTDDNSGRLYSFETGRVGGSIFVDGFETSSDWNLGGEWEIDTPQGMGGNDGGYADPTSAYNGAKVLGTDLTGLGTYPGDYEPNCSWNATSPVMDTSSLANGRLIIRRWLNVDQPLGDQATIWGCNGNKCNDFIWQNVGNVSDYNWTVQTYDISALQYSRFRIRFSIDANSGGQRSGWNIDNVIIKDGSKPESEPCGSCTTMPSFAGLKTATDPNPCGDTGISLSWAEPVAWGSSYNGSYAVYRDTTPNFTPSFANLVVTGLTTTSYMDTAAPNDITLYYLVRAENSETCSTGPNNGGVVDDNTAYVSVIDTTSQIVPGDVGSTLILQKINGVHTRLSWTAVADAAEYYIYRADNPQMIGAQRIATTIETFHDDKGDLMNLNDRYYTVKASNSCGQEGP